ncbi:MAG: SDR family NAD(P)-dependent oxidoreductase [Bacteroidetes bacterium]|nr:SDR family NAD(P)-dependent oxidoreductase [Bacteroidota bacterium]
MISFKNKTVFITGASSGIGKAAADLFAADGAKLLLCARRFEKLEQIKKEYEEKYNSKVHIFKLDVRNSDDVEREINALLEEWKDIDLLLNNAGLSRGLDKIQDGKIQDWDEMIDTNVKGLLYVSKNVIPLMMKKKYAHIINLGSIAGKELYPAGNVYCASKFAVDAITKGMRIDLMDTSIKVSTVDPGLVKTDFSLVRFRGDQERAKVPYMGIEALTPEDVAETIFYVATRNENVNIAEVTMFPKAQAGAAFILRKN